MTGITVKLEANGDISTTVDWADEAPITLQDIATLLFALQSGELSANVEMAVWQRAKGSPFGGALVSKLRACLDAPGPLVHPTEAFGRDG